MSQLTPTLYEIDYVPLSIIEQMVLVEYYDYIKEYALLLLCFLSEAAGRRGITVGIPLLQYNELYALKVSTIFLSFRIPLGCDRAERTIEKRAKNGVADRAHSGTVVLIEIGPRI